MQTHTSHKKGTHRWLVVAPFFVMFLALSMREGVEHRSATADLTLGSSKIISAQGTVKNVTVGESVLRLDPGSRVDISEVSRPALIDGSVLVVSKSLSHLHVGSMDLEGWNGGFQVTKQGSEITVAALTTPVFVVEGNHQTIVPAFMQWNGATLTSSTDGVSGWLSSRALHSLPVSFSADQLQTIQSLISTLVMPVPTVDTSILPSLLGQDLRLAPARDRAESAERQNRVNALLQAFSQNSGAADSLLKTDDIHDLLASSEGQDVLPDLLSLAVSQGKGDFLLSFFTMQPDRLLLASFHPLLRNHVRVLPVTATLSDDEQWSLLLLTPASDILPQAISDIAVQQWQSSWQNFVQSKTGVKTFTDSLPLLKGEIDRLDALEYAKRVDTYASAILTLAEPLDHLSSDATTTLADLHTLRDQRRSESQISDPPVAPQSSSASSSSQASSVDPVVLIQQARDILLQQGFMTTAQTSFTPASGHVSVQDIVFGTAKGDITLQFTFDPTTEAVSEIQQDGKTLPYSISLQQFMEWLKS